MELQIPERQFRLRRCGDPPGNRSDAREKDIQFEGLGQVVVRAAIQSVYDIGTRVARGNDDHRRVQASLPQPPQDAQSIHAGKHDIEQNDVDVGRQSQLQSSLSVIGKEDGMTLGLKRSADQIGGIRPIFGNQYANILILTSAC
jgi:hypothetical protein